MTGTAYQPAYAASRALVVGINSYSDPRFVPLGKAEDDARAFADTISAPPYNFAVDILLGQDATKMAIQEGLVRLYKTGPDDRVLVYFAGHGYTLTDQFGNEAGYLACVDTVPEKHFTALELNEMLALCRHAKAKHIGFVLDACFSGQALGLTRATGVAADKFLTRRAFQVITAGAGDQTVTDYRSMTQTLLAVMRESAEQNELITLNTLGLHIQQRMATDSGQTPIPQFGHLAGSQGGDFVLYEPPQAAPIEKLPIKLQRALKNSDADVRCLAIDLAEDLLGDPQVGKAVREVLEEMAVDDPDREVRRRALEALRTIPQPPAVPSPTQPPAEEQPTTLIVRPTGPLTPPAEGEPPQPPVPIPLTEANVFETGPALPYPPVGTVPASLPFEPDLVAVPAGPFLMGNDGGYPDETPQHTIELGPFGIGLYPVTVSQFRAFIEAGGYQDERFWLPSGWTWCQRSNVVAPRYWNEPEWSGDDMLPVVGVHWFEAVAYCAWLATATGFAYRLPTEAEWEKAARGTEGLVYPWGNEFDPARCNTSESGIGRTMPVGSFPQGASPYGAMDMAGGVWEWTLSAYGEYPYNPDDGREDLTTGARRVVRGGSWSDSFDSARTTFRDSLNPYDRHYSVGFRVACTLVPSESS